MANESRILKMNDSECRDVSEEKENGITEAQSTASFNSSIRTTDHEHEQRKEITTN